MFSLLVLSLALSAPAGASAPQSAQSNPLVTSSAPLVIVGPGTPLLVEAESPRPFDDMEIHPESDICYRIRFFQFSKGQHPKFVREMTCGPKSPATKNTDGTKPGLMPLDLKAKPSAEREQDIPVQ